MARTNPDEYDEMYDVEECRKENAEIKRILTENIPKGSAVVDLGSGTGLGWELLKDHISDYAGVDISLGFTECAVMKHGNDLNGYQMFFCEPAEEFVKRLEYIDCAMALFAIDFMDPTIIDDVYRLMRDGGVFVVLHANQPYLLDSTSEWYRGLPEYFEWRFGENQRMLLKKFKDYGADTQEFMGGKTHFVTVMKK